jgi:diphosphomevalonate decarboxylase
MHEARARARSNMALVKYWGKRDDALVLPYTGSLSMTLDALATETRVRFTGESGPDRFSLDDGAAGAGETRRVTQLLDLIRAQRPGLGAAVVESTNGFPTAGGLASSASGFAALAAAASWAAGLDPTPEALSILARRASGSACRSVLGGFVEWTRGERDDGLDSLAVQRQTPGSWDVAMVIAAVDAGRKERSSRDAMKESVLTSPFFAAWVETTAADLREAKSALDARDIERLGAVTERSFRKMHATALAATPATLFWQPATFTLLEEVRRLRASGTGAWATIDAGPHVAVLCAGGDAERIRERLAGAPSVHELFVARPGPGVERL